MKAEVQSATKKDNLSPSIPIAIVGIGSLFPEAKTVGEFWNGILSRKNCIREIVDSESVDLDGYWRLRDYYNSDPSAPDKTYGKTGAFLPEVEFDPVEFGIPPINLESISTIQLMALLVAKEALADAGYNRDQSTASKRDRTGVILGVAGCGNTAFPLATRTNFPQWEQVIRNFGFSKELTTAIVEKLKNLYSEWKESSFPGLLGNVVAGRITSYFDLGGTNCTLDAACASSLAAIKMAISELVDGSCDAVLTGGVNVDNSIFAYMCFSKTPALSKAGISRPFDVDSDGMVLGDGIGMVVLKRLEDAERDHDRIYGVIRGIGTSSDGRAKSIYAPRFEGQVRALERAYQRTKLTPRQIQLIEAHGTGTVAGDLCELKSLSSVYREQQVPKHSVALGSVKSQIGHTRTAAGVASLIKVALSLYHKILPPTINITQPNSQLDIESSSFYLNTEARPWIQPVDNSKRRAAVSSFGFGGTNFHMIVEEHQQEHDARYRMHTLPDIVLLHAPDRKMLISKCGSLLEQLKAGTGNYYHQYLNEAKSSNIPLSSARLGFVSESLEQMIDYLEISLSLLRSNPSDVWQHPKGIYYRATGRDLRGRVVALFPGQGSQYLNMGLDFSNNYPEMRKVLLEADKFLFKQRGLRLSDVIYPPTAFDEKTLAKQKHELRRTEYAQPAIGAISAGMYKLLQKAGFKPNFIIGHSFGELTALWASGALNDEAFYRLAIARGHVMGSELSLDKPNGAMLAVNTGELQIKKLLASFEDVRITNYNSTSQIVLGGTQQSIEKLNLALQEMGIKSTLLDVSDAFHTDFVRAAVEPFAREITSTNFATPSVPVYSNVTAEPYPSKIEALKQILADHLLSPVAFKQCIEAVYSRGGSVFIEIGPKSTLSSFVDDILRDREHVAVALNPNSYRSSECEFRRSIARLLVEGLDLQDVDPYQQLRHVKQSKEQGMSPIILNGSFYLNPKTKQSVHKALYERDTSFLDAFIEKRLPESQLQNSQITVPPLQVAATAIQNGMTLTQDGHVASTSKTDQTISTPSKTNSDENEESLMSQTATFTNQAVDANQYREDNGTSSNAIASYPTTNQDGINSQVQAQNLLSVIHQQFHHNQGKCIELLSKMLDHQSTLLEKYGDSEVLPKLMQNFEQTLHLLQNNLSHLNMSHQGYLQHQLALLKGTQPPINFSSPAIETTFSPFSANQSMSGTATDTPVPASAAVDLPKSESAVANAFTKSTDMASVQTSVDGHALTAEVPPAATQSAIATPMLRSVVISSGNSDASPENSATTYAATEAKAESLASKATIDSSQTVGTSVESTSILSSPVSNTLVENPFVTAPGEPLAVVNDEVGAIPNVSFNVNEFSKRLLEIVSDKTGYPIDMLDVNMDLEGDLGIDSIKQVEILGAIYEDYPELEVDSTEAAENLPELRTLAEIINFIVQSIEQVKTTDVLSQPQQQTNIERQVVKKNT
jgi:polyketide-type polyunsaturated fatty acid synthase PfaA